MECRRVSYKIKGGVLCFLRLPMVSGLAGLGFRRLQFGRSGTERSVALSVRSGASRFCCFQ